MIVRILDSKLSPYFYTFHLNYLEFPDNSVKAQLHLMVKIIKQVLNI